MRNCLRAVCVIGMLISAMLCGLEAQAASLQTLRVGYVPGTGFLEEDRPGHLRGYGYEYMEFLAEYGGWKFEYVPCVNWWECGEKLQSGEIDLLPAMPGNYKSLPFAVRGDHVVARFPMELVVQEHWDKPFLQLGTLDYNYPIPSLPNVAKEYGFQYRLIEYHDAQDMENAFHQGLLDGYVGPMLHPEKSDHVLSVFDRVSYRVLVRKDRTELLAKLNYAMDQMLLNQPNLRNRLNDKYGRSKGFPLILTRPEQEYLRERQKLTVIVMLRQKPYLFQENGEWKGATAELLHQISEDLGVEIEILDGRSLEEIKRMITRGSVDFVANAPCDFSWLDAMGLSPTQPYMDIGYVPVMRKGSSSLKNPRAAAVRDSFQTQDYIEENFQEDRIRYYDTMEECFQAVSNGEADITYAPRAVVPYLMEKAETYNLEADTEARISESVSLAVWDGADPRLWQILNKEVNHLPPGLVSGAVRNVAKDVVFHWNPKWLLYHHPLQAAMIIFAVMAATLGIFWYRTYMRKRHLLAVQEMAYTNTRYMLHNMLWLDQEMPALFKKVAGEMPDSQMYCAVLSTDRKSSIVEMYGRDLLDRQVRDTAENLQAKPWVLQTVAGADEGQLVSICVAKDDAEIMGLIEEVVAEYGYLTTSDARISLHLHAGICPMKQGDFLLEIADRANTAGQETLGTMDDVKFFDKEMKERLELEQRIEANMEKALQQGEFRAWYQPKYDIRTRRIVGAEALVRWQSASMGFMPPGKFIPLFEANGFVIPVDYYLLEQAFALQKRRLSEGKKVVPISVNQSRLHITEEGYLEKMKAIVEKYRLPKGLIELEITETMFGDFDQKAYREHSAHIMGELHKLGFSLSLDDFGSGFSSFTMLDYLPLDVMKIDRSLLVASDHSERMRDILGNVIRLGETLHMHVICEGIETTEQEQMLLRLGCHYGQGYLNAKPMPEKEFVEFIEKRNQEVGWDDAVG
ncbi:MAG: EAL domain-containing protein [Selenomonadaceae bacterium]|nr:EAL domain-containing protein [Selenomonadaceae bacterium]